MSRLDSVIRRLKAQRACLNFAAEQLAGRAGLILELGLGNGRTYDHLGELFGREAIYVFDRRVAAHPACIPPHDRLLLGDIRETLPAAAQRLGRRVILAHCDIGTGVEAENRRLAAFLAHALAPLLAPGGLLISDQPIELADSVALPLPAGVPAERYFIRRVCAA